MTTPTQRYASLRAALALNNMAVSTLEHGHVNEALRTFNDSLEVIRLASTNSSPCDKKNIREMDKRTEQMLRSCTARTSKLRKRQSPRVRPDLEICAIDDDWDVDAMRSALSRMNPTSWVSVFVATPIRLRCSSLEKSLDFQAATILYNVGLTHLIAYPASKQTESGQRKKFLTRSLKNLSLAYSLS